MEVRKAALAVQRRTESDACSLLSMLGCRSGGATREWKNVLCKSTESNRGAEDSPGGADKAMHAPPLLSVILRASEHRSGGAMREWKNVLCKSTESNGGAEDSPPAVQRRTAPPLLSIVDACLSVAAVGVSQRKHEKRVEERSLQVNRE